MEKEDVFERVKRRICKGLEGEKANKKLFHFIIISKIEEKLKKKEIPKQNKTKTVKSVLCPPTNS